MSRFCKNPALYAFKWSESALLRLLGLFLKNKKVCTCFVTAATAVQKLLAALRYLWALRSAMAESSRGKLVLFFKTASVTRRRTHTPCQSAGVCASFCISEVCPFCIHLYMYSIYIYICEYVSCLWCVGIWERAK